MNELIKQNEKTMTTKELAQVLGVSIDTITRVANKVIDPSAVLHRVINGGKSKIFTEEQAILIKQEIQKHHNLSSRQIDSVSTEYEENQTITNAIMILQRRASEYKERMEIAESALNRLENAEGCFSINQTAKALKLPYGNKTLFKEFIKMGILNEDHSPRQEHINAEHFKVVVKFINDVVGVKSVTLTTGKGLVYLAKKFHTEVDKSVLPDA